MQRFLIVGIGAIVLSSTSAFADCPMSWKAGDGIPGVNGSVYAVTNWDPDGAGPQPELLIAAGKFTVAGNVIANNIAAWDGRNWKPMASGLPGGFGVYCLAVYHNKIFAGGDFRLETGSSLTGTLAEWDGTAWHVVASSSWPRIYALTVYNDKLIFGRGVGNGYAVFQYDGTSTQFLGQGFNGDVRALTVYNGKLIAGGRFTLVPGGSANRIAQWNGTNWQPIGSGVGGTSNPDVYALTVHEGNLIAGGRFTTAGNTDANYVARWDGANWYAYGEGATDYVNALTVFDGALLAGGWSSTLRWNRTTWEPYGILGRVSAYTVYMGDLVEGGDFTGSKEHSIAHLNRGNWSPLGIGTNDPISAMHVYNGSLIAGGSFDSIGGVHANHIGQWNGTSWMTMGEGLNGTVSCLETFNGDLIAGGLFTIAGRVSAIRIARWDGQGWHAMGSGFEPYYASVGALIVYNGTLIAAGYFSNSGETELSNIAQWDGAQWQPLALGVSDNVSDLAVYDGKLIAAGGFNVAGGESVQSVAQWDGSTWSSVGPGLYDVVLALTEYQGNLVAGGRLRFVGGPAGRGINAIAQWDGNNWLQIGNIGGNSDSNRVNALTVMNGDLIAAGYFPPGTTSNRVIRWNGSSWKAIGSVDAPQITSLKNYNGTLFMGGSFTIANGGVSAYLARYGPDCPRGDMNCDQTINTNDIPSFVAAILDSDSLSDCTRYLANVNADVNPDGTGRLDGLDILAFTNALLTP